MVERHDLQKSGLKLLPSNSISVLHKESAAGGAQTETEVSFAIATLPGAGYCEGLA
jgi:hypothetical protein